MRDRVFCGEDSVFVARGGRSAGEERGGLPQAPPTPAPPIGRGDPCRAAHRELPLGRARRCCRDSQAEALPPRGGRERGMGREGERGREPRTTSVPLRISFRALVRASEVPSPPLLLSSPLASLLSRRRGSSLCRGRSPPPRPTTTRTTPATRGAAAAAAATTRHK